jgi:acyl-CoA thioesterase
MPSGSSPALTHGFAPLPGSPPIAPIQGAGCIPARAPRGSRYGTGMSIVDDVRARMRADRFAAACGVRLVAIEEGYARATLRLRRSHLNGVGVAQGGAIFTLADLAFAAACNSHGTVAVALDASVTYLRGLARGVLTAEAREVFPSRKVSVCEIQVTGPDGELVALFRGTAYRRDPATRAPAAPAPVAHRTSARPSPPAATSRRSRPARRGRASATAR